MPQHPPISPIDPPADPTAASVKNLARHERCTVLVANRDYYCVPHSVIRSNPGPHVIRIGSRWTVFRWDDTAEAVVTQSPDGYLPVRQYTVFWFVFQYYAPTGRVFHPASPDPYNQARGA